MEDVMGDHDPALDKPPAKSREQMAYEWGLAADIPPPQIMDDPVLLAAWNRGLDEYGRQPKGRLP
jgi:hypothetical protein